MNLEKTIFAFVIVLAMTINYGFFLGEIDNPVHHNVYELFAAIVVSLIATVMKLGERTQIGALLLATSLVADVQLIIGVLAWGSVLYVTETGLTPHAMAAIVSLSGGALLANVVSVVLLVAETIMGRR